jgi:ketosteroid isomerase-like protein
MKKVYLILSVAVVVITACQQKPETVPVNIEAEKAAIDSIFDKFNAAFNAQDVATLASYLTEDALCCGTDPSEFWNKQQITDIWTQAFADSTPKPELNLISEREIKVAADGNSAIVVDQYMLPIITPKIPWRNVYHLVKTNDNWMIIFLNCGFIPKNEDIPKLNKALEQ